MVVNDPEDEFLKSLRETFKVEALEHLQAMATGLLDLEKSSDPALHLGFIEGVYRAAHSLKGAARAVNFTEIEMHCQSLEDAFSIWKRKGTAPSAQTLDRAHRTLDNMSRVLTGTAAPKATGTPSPVLQTDQVAGPEPSLMALDSLSPEKASPGETIRIAASKLDARLLEAEEMLTAKLAVGQHAAEMLEFSERFEVWTKEWTSLHPIVRGLRQTLERQSPGSSSLPGELARLMEFLDWNHDYVRSLESKAADISQAARQDRFVVGKLVDDLLEDSKKLLMLPLATIGSVFPKVVRDLCRDQGKEADFVIRGEEVEIDKRILEEMKDAIIHILRNCVDHGIEIPGRRRDLGKPPRATITLAVSPVNGNKIEFLVSDDGAGIATEKVKASSVKHGLLSEEEAGRLTEPEALALIFRADVSTSPVITQLSGRGLGLAIVREKAEKLGGSVSVESAPNAGSSIRITLPIALATFHGVLVQSAGRLFVLPTSQVVRVGRFKRDDVKTVENHETLSLDGRAVALVHLSAVLELPLENRESNVSESSPFVILGMGEHRVAFVVDAVLEEREVLVKRLGKPLSRVRNIAGATVLASGRVVPILNILDLLKSAKKAGGLKPSLSAPKPASAVHKSILVAEDSITSRMLLKGILESAGYQVKTAVDGMEAFTLLRANSFHLVVSDVEMPRLNGFGLTAKIRADKKFSELPVILVTALETREDRERGIDAGANAYLIKSDFDQSNLLETIRRLI